MIGVDLVYIPEFKQQLKLGQSAFLQKTFTKSELKNKNLEHLAGVWAAKEAIIKACSLDNTRLTDIKISHLRNGKLFGKIKDRDIELSIAHHGDYAIAIALEVK